MTRIGAALATGALSVALLAGASPAFAADEIGLSWTAGGPSVSQFTTPVFENIVVVPGASGARTFHVRNESTSAGHLKAKITNLRVTGLPDDAFYADFLVNGVPAADILAGATHSLSDMTLAAGASTELSLDYVFPASSTSGNGAGRAAAERVSVSFDVAVELRGDRRVDPTETPEPTDTPNPTDTPDPTDTPSPTETPRPSGSPDPSASPTPGGTGGPSSTAEAGVVPPPGAGGFLSTTGAATWVPLAGAAVLLAAGGTALRRFRRSAEPGERA